MNKNLPYVLITGELNANDFCNPKVFLHGGENQDYMVEFLDKEENNSLIFNSIIRPNGYVTCFCPKPTTQLLIRVSSKKDGIFYEKEISHTIARPISETKLEEYPKSGIENQNIVVCHVGGKCGTIGEPTDILSSLPDKPFNKILYLFEADIVDQYHTETDLSFVNILSEKHNIKGYVLPYCVSDRVGESNFYLHRDRRSSSVFPVDPRARLYVFPSDSICPMWGNHCIADQIVRVKTTTFDELCKKEIPHPVDFLSMDSQGSEYAILEGSKTLLNGDLLGVSTEVEFTPIYKGQHPFSDIDRLLRSHEFIFFNFISTQEWFFGEPCIGRPSLVVAEIVYFRDYLYFINRYEHGEYHLDDLFFILFKLSVCAFSFHFNSYACQVVNYMEKRWKDQYEDYLKRNVHIAQYISKYNNV